MTPHKTFQQISEITSKLVSVSLSVEQNFPSSKNGIIYISEKNDSAIVLKNIPYREVYSALDRKKNYNIKMVDGALIQFMYQFNGEELIRSRLAFFPSPDLEEFQNNSEVYETDELYADVIHQNIVTTPLRFDYDPESFEKVRHPSSHFTIGQYQNCRIPVAVPMTPNHFIDFILRNFYNTAHTKFSDNLNFDLSTLFQKTIHEDEEKILHLNIN